MKTKTRKGVPERYLAALITIKDQLQKDEKSNLNAICSHYGISKAVPSVMRRLGYIRVSLNGNRWLFGEPSLEMVESILEIMRKYASENMKKTREKRKQTIQPSFEWEKPQPKTETVVNYEYKPQPDSSLVSEFIDHHEQSLLPHVQSNVKTAEIVKSERLFQLRIFGINLFTVKY
jgi:hypothetical protein